MGQALMHKFSMKHRDMFNILFGTLKKPLAEHSFSWIYLWDYYNDIAWTKINGSTCLFLSVEGKRYLWGPILPGNRLLRTLNECFRRYDLSAVMYIPEELKSKYDSLEGYKLKKQNKDYIHKTVKVIELKGKKYKDKRNKRNFFVKNYDFNVESYSKRHKQACEDLIKRWKKQKEDFVSQKDKSKFEADIDANLKLLGLAKPLNVKGIVVRVNNVVEGFIFGTRSDASTCTMFFGKTNLQIKGLSQFIFSEFLSRFFQETKYVNDGEDWGVASLEKSKMSYDPMVRNSYMLVKDG